MEKVSTYTYLGIPDPLSITLVLLLLSLSLVPFAAGADFGPLKVPSLRPSVSARLKWAAPLLLFFSMMAFFPFWPGKTSADVAMSAEKYRQQLVNGSSSLVGQLVAISKHQAVQHRLWFADSKWAGGPNWGTVIFEADGRTAAYSNESGKAPGTLLLQGLASASALLIVGEWQQSDGQSGVILLDVPQSTETEDNVLRVKWGPGFTRESRWTPVVPERTPVYIEKRSSACQILEYNTGTGPECGANYRNRRDAVCGVDLFRMGESDACGEATLIPIKSLGYSRGHKSNFCRARGYQGHDGRGPNGHCLDFPECRHSSFGVE